MAVSPTGTRHPAGGPQPVTACLYPSVRLLTLAIDPPSSKRPIVLVALILTAIGLMSVFRPWSSTFAAKSNDIKAVPAPAPAASGGEMAPTVEDPSGEAYVFSLEDLCGYAESEQKAQRFLDDFSAAIEQFEAALNAAKTRLAVSGDPEHLHTAALLEDDPARRIELITRALAADGENAFRVWGAVHMCVGAYAETNCPLQSWQERMLAVDSENREAWLEAAAIRISAGAEGAALHAMQRAASASESRVYWPETVE